MLIHQALIVIPAVSLAASVPAHTVRSCHESDPRQIAVRLTQMRVVGDGMSCRLFWDRRLRVPDSGPPEAGDGSDSGPLRYSPCGYKRARTTGTTPGQDDTMRMRCVSKLGGGCGGGGGGGGGMPHIVEEPHVRDHGSRPRHAITLDGWAEPVQPAYSGHCRRLHCRLQCS